MNKKGNRAANRSKNPKTLVRPPLASAAISSLPSCSPDAAEGAPSAADSLPVIGSDDVPEDAPDDSGLVKKQISGW
jgi:hypothetical protein